MRERREGEAAAVEAEGSQDAHDVARGAAPDGDGVVERDALDALGTAPHVEVPRRRIQRCTGVQRSTPARSDTIEPDITATNDMPMSSKRSMDDGARHDSMRDEVAAVEAEGVRAARGRGIGPTLRV